jgi:uncharacterized protein YbaR (Trm112 family)
MSDKVPYCERCELPFPTWLDFALHVASSSKPHRQSTRIWAAHFLVDVKNVKSYKPKAPEQEHTDFGEEQREKYWHREISGEIKRGLVKCPQCKQLYPIEIEVEYVQDNNWRDDNGKLMIVCGNCRTNGKLERRSQFYANL